MAVQKGRHVLTARTLAAGSELSAERCRVPMQQVMGQFRLEGNLGSNLVPLSAQNKVSSLRPDQIDQIFF